MCVHVERVSVNGDIRDGEFIVRSCASMPESSAFQRVIASGKIPVLASSKCPISWALSCKHIGKHIAVDEAIMVVQKYTLKNV